MGHYFSLPHLGAGSPEVESLGCYFYRLAKAHDCSVGQLACHLRAWSEAMCGGLAPRYCPEALINQPLAMCGYGQSVRSMVQSLVLATNVPTLRSGTLLSLHNVGARTALRTLRVQRAWCPACYAEDLEGADEPYDRLLWAIVPIKRCAVHKLALLTQCPRCRASQNYAVGVHQLDRCACCAGSLIGRDSFWKQSPNPFFGERLIYELIGACASNPDLTLHWESLAAFYKQARQELSPNHVMRTRRSFSRSGVYPTLDSLLELATTFNISLLDFQNATPPALNLPLYGPSCSSAGQSRPRQTQATHAQVKAELEKVLTSDTPLPPHRTFCEALGVSQGFVNYRFPLLTESYRARRDREREAEKEANARAAMQALADGLWAAYREGRITQQKELIGEIVRLAKVSIPIARKALANWEGDQQAAASRHRCS